MCVISATTVQRKDLKANNDIHKWLRKLADVLAERRLEANRTSPSSSKPQIHFITQGAEGENISQREWSILKPGCKWQMKVDLNQKLKFPPKITTISRWPDIILLSISAKTVIMAELTVPWEEVMEAAFRGKGRTTASLLQCVLCESEWKTCTYPVKVRCQGFVENSPSSRGCTRLF